MYTMNHPSEWGKFFHKSAGRYRYKLKGSGVVRDTLAAIGKAFKKCTTKAAQKAGKGTAEKAGKKLSEAVVEKGSDKIQQLLRKRRPKSTPRTAPAKSKETPRDDAMLKLSQILANQL